MSVIVNIITSPHVKMNIATIIHQIAFAFPMTNSPIATVAIPVVIETSGDVLTPNFMIGYCTIKTVIALIVIKIA